MIQPGSLTVLLQVTGMHRYPHSYNKLCCGMFSLGWTDIERNFNTIGVLLFIWTLSSIHVKIFSRSTGGNPNTQTVYTICRQDLFLRSIIEGLDVCCWHGLSYSLVKLFYANYLTLMLRNRLRFSYVSLHC